MTGLRVRRRAFRERSGGVVWACKAMERGWRRVRAAIILRSSRKMRTVKRAERARRAAVEQKAEETVLRRAGRRYEPGGVVILAE